jgi:putative membrane protein
LKNFPLLNVTLNFASALFLIIGFLFIKKKKITYHKICMLTAFTFSVLFLISYLIYHYNVGTTKFTKHGIVRYIYFLILGSHTIFAAIVPFLAIYTIFLALKSQITKHKKIAPISLAIWLYVNLTGILIYFMLY